MSAFTTTVPDIAFRRLVDLNSSEPPVFVTDLSQVIQLPPGAGAGDEVLVLKAIDGDETLVNETKIRYLKFST